MDFHVEPMNNLDQQPQHLHSGKPGRKKGMNTKLLLIAAAVIIVVALAVGAFFLLKKDTKDNQTAQNQTSQPQNEETAEPTLPPAEAAQPQAYKSTTLNIEITHRKDWKITEDAENKLLVLSSPKFTYQTGSGDSKKGVFTLHIGFGASKEAQATIDQSKAVRDSLLIGYDAPTESQRHYTNVSFAGPDETTFQLFIVTGSIALKTGTALAGSIIINSADFLIAGGFGEDAQASLSFDSISSAELEQYSAYEQALAIVKSLKVF